MSASRQADILVPGASGLGKSLILSAPISFWGGVDPKAGRIVDVRHPQFGEEVAGRVMFLPGTIGSSSASAVLLELIHRGKAPAALVLDHPDAILLLGLIVAREMGWETPIALKLGREHFPGFEGQVVAASDAGMLSVVGSDL